MIEETPPPILVEAMLRDYWLSSAIPYVSRWYRVDPDPTAIIEWRVVCPCERGDARPDRVQPVIGCRYRAIRFGGVPGGPFWLVAYVGGCLRCDSILWAANWGREDGRSLAELGPEEAILCDLMAETWPESRGSDPEPIRLRGLNSAWATGLAEHRDCMPWYTNPGHGTSAPIPLRRETLRGPRGELAVLLGRCLRCAREFWGGRLEYSGPDRG